MHLNIYHSTLIHNRIYSNKFDQFKLWNLRDNWSVSQFILHASKGLPVLLTTKSIAYIVIQWNIWQKDIYTFTTKPRKTFQIFLAGWKGIGQRVTKIELLLEVTMVIYEVLITTNVKHLSYWTVIQRVGSQGPGGQMPRTLIYNFTSVVFSKLSTF